MSPSRAASAASISASLIPISCTCRKAALSGPSSCSRRRAGASEVGRFGLGHVIVEENAVSFGADLLIGLLSDAPVAPLAGPGLVERFSVVDAEDHFHRLPAIHHSPALYDMQLLAVRRTIDVDDGPRIHADRVDDERVAFVVADGLAVP